MDESFTGGGFSTTQGGSGTASAESKEGVAPLVIKQILQLGDDGIKIFGFSYGVISLVAIVRSVEHTSTRIMYKLEDHTGSIDALLWLEDGKTETKEPIEMNTYVQVYGMARSHNGSKVIMLFKIMPIKNANAITTHLLEVMHARFQAEQFLRMIQNGADTTSSTKDFMDVDTSSSNLANGLKGKQLLVYQAIKNHGTDEGISLQQIHQKFKHIPLPEIRQITEAMSLEGHIYSSIDTEHFLPTE
ncbi:replication protein A 32 kDa subunit [Phlebotomus papatasi]|uniref:replication protein A 32 kDa subunit n=1 Tax=Phlebotomus papatasi TaxID=29031 RepID=UPI0024843BFD|nr:replication protein A 32 kDa subunit [Phlebotomus papatasi]